MTQLLSEFASLPVEGVFDGELVAFGDDRLPSFERDLSVIFGTRVAGDDGASDHVVPERSLDLGHASTRAEESQLELFVLSVAKGLASLIEEDALRMELYLRLRAWEAAHRASGVHVEIID
jgi:hypothetical protein